MTIFDNLRQNLTSLELPRLAFPTHRIKSQLAETYIKVLDLIVCVTEYCAIGRICEFSTSKYQPCKLIRSYSEACRCNLIEA